MSGTGSRCHRSAAGRATIPFRRANRSTASVSNTLRANASRKPDTSSIIPRASAAPPSTASRDFARAGRVDEHPVPELQHQETPEPEMVERAPFGVLIDQATDHLWAEVAAPSGVLTQEHVVRHVLQLVAEPVVDRYAEAHLLAARDPRREHVLHDSLKEILLRQSAK